MSEKHEVTGSSPVLGTNQTASCVLAVLLMGRSHSGLVRGTGNAVGCKPSRVQISLSPPITPCTMCRGLLYLLRAPPHGPSSSTSGARTDAPTAFLCPRHCMANANIHLSPWQCHAVGCAILTYGLHAIIGARTYRISWLSRRPNGRPYGIPLPSSLHGQRQYPSLPLALSCRWLCNLDLRSLRNHRRPNGCPHRDSCGVLQMRTHHIQCGAHRSQSIQRFICNHTVGRIIHR
jgi:hypothetical protein